MMTTTPDMAAHMLEAVIERDTAVVLELLDAGMSPNHADSNGTSILFLAAKTDDCMTMKALLEAGADPNAGFAAMGPVRDAGLAAHEFRTPLNYACARGYRTAITLLLDYGADPTIGTEHGRTAAHLLLWNGTENKSSTPLFKKFVEKTVLRMIEGGVNVSSADIHGMSLLQSALIGHKPDMVKVLLNHGADPTQQLHDGMQLIHSAASHGRHDVINMLREAGIDFNATDNHGRTAIFYAGDESTVQLLLALGCDPQHVDVDEKNAGHVLIGDAGLDEVSQPILTYLIEAGLDARQPDKSGETVLDILESPGYEDYEPARALRVVVAAADARRAMRTAIERTNHSQRP